jgi:hypothetical protein
MGSVSEGESGGRRELAKHGNDPVITRLPLAAGRFYVADETAKWICRHPS